MPTVRWTEEQFARYQEARAGGQNQPPEERCAVVLDKMALRDEKRLQRDAERWLHLRGYWRLTADNAEAAGGPPRGWFGHWPEAQRNPLMPDLLILDARMQRCLCIELKVRSCYQPGQRDMIARGAWVECRTLDEVALRVAEWENAEAHGRRSRTVQPLVGNSGGSDA